MTRDPWPDTYDGAPHPDRSRPEDHNDMHPIAWRERQTQKTDPCSVCGKRRDVHSGSWIDSHKFSAS